MSEISLYTLKKPSFDSSLSEEDITTGVGKVSFAQQKDSITSCSQKSRRHQTNEAQQQKQQRPTTANSTLSVRNESRQFNTINFVPPATVQDFGGLDIITNMSPEDQEVMLTRELLIVLSGCESRVIVVHETISNQINFTVLLTHLLNSLCI
jgi:hypothetical protein